MSNDKNVEDRLSRIFGAYDIRGIVGDDLDSITVMEIARAYRTTFTPMNREVSLLTMTADRVRLPLCCAWIFMPRTRLC